MAETKKPKVNSAAAEELKKVEKQFDEFDKNVQEMTMDRMNAAPKKETEPQTKLSQQELEKSKIVHLKPFRSIPSREKFNEDYREAYNFDKEPVNFIAENKEVIGETIELWTKPYPGLPAEFWKVPVNTPVWGPRYLAEQIKSKFYHRLTMQQNVATESSGIGQFYGAMAVDTTVQRLDALPVSTRKSVFMGSKNF